MQIQSKSGHIFELPHDEEEARIQAGIRADSHTYEATDFSRMLPVGCPKAAITKERVTIRSFLK